MFSRALVITFLVFPLAPAQEPPEPKSDEELKQLIQKAGESKDNEGADLVTVFKRTAADVEDSGLAHVRSHELIKCLTEKGAAQLCRVRLDYDPTSNKVELRSLRILRKDGAAETIPPESGVDLPQPQDGIYWGPRMLLYPIPRLATGDAIEVKTYMKGFLIAYLEDLEGGKAEGDEKYIPPMRGHFYDVVTFDEGWPVKLRHYTVSTPRQKPVQFEVYGGGVRSFVGFDSEKLVYRFWLENLPAVHSEPRAVDPSDIRTKVVLTTVPSWADKSRWFAEVNEPQFSADAAIAARVADLTRGMTTDEEKIAAIVHWSADNIRYSGITMGQGEGYTLHPGPMIYRDRSGVCKDKAGMAITMLRAAGYTVYPAMTMAGSRVERIPADQFNHCVVALKKKDGSFQMLDPTWVVFSPELWSSAEGEQHYLIGTPEGQDLMKTPAFSAEENKIRLESRAVLSEDGTLSGKLVIGGKGLSDQRLRRELVHSTTSRDRQSWFEKVIGGLGPGATVEKVHVTYPQIQNIREPLRLEVSYKVPRYAMVSGNAMYVVPPMSRHILRMPSIAPYLGLAGAEKRTQAIQLTAPRMQDIVETLTLPSGFQATRLPKDRALDGKAAALAARVEAKGRELQSSYRIEIKRREVPVEDYESFRRVVKELESLPSDVIVLERRS